MVLNCFLAEEAPSELEESQEEESEDMADVASSSSSRGRGRPKKQVPIPQEPGYVVWFSGLINDRLKKLFRI